MLTEVTIISYKILLMIFYAAICEFYVAIECIEIYILDYV